MASFKQWAENQSVEIRNQLGLKPWDYLSPSLLAEFLKVKVLTSEQVILIDPYLSTFDFAGWSGTTIKFGESFIIIHNHSHSPQRQDSNVMHELAHLICKHELEPLTTIDGLLLRDYSKKKESEAEWLGGCLQLPKVALFSSIKRGADAKELLSKYNVSVEMLRYRINMTGIKKVYKNFII